MGQLQDRFNSMLNMVGWSAAISGHPLAQIINDKRYERKFKPIERKLAEAAAHMYATGDRLEELEEMENRLKPNYESKEKESAEDTARMDKHGNEIVEKENRGMNPNYESKEKESAEAAARMDKHGDKLEDIENRLKLDYTSESAEFAKIQRDIAEDYDKFKNEMKYPHSISKDADIRDYLKEFDVARDSLGYKLQKGVVKQQLRTDEEALKNSYRAIAQKEIATQNRKKMKEYMWLLGDKGGR